MPPNTDVMSTVVQTLLAAGVGAFAANFIAELIKGHVRKSQALEMARDDDLSVMLTIVDELQNLSTDYWKASAIELGDEETVARARLMARLQHVLELIADLFTGAPKRDCDYAFTKVMDSIGGGDFGNPDRQAGPERLTSIYSSCLSFKHLAKKCRRGLRRGLLA